MLDIELLQLCEQLQCLTTKLHRSWISLAMAFFNFFWHAYHALSVLLEKAHFYLTQHFLIISILDVMKSFWPSKLSLLKLEWGLPWFANSKSGREQNIEGTFNFVSSTNYTESIFYSKL